jgi:autophagy-related protein 9
MNPILSYYARHYNELSHEHRARMSRAYRPAAQYAEQFTSRLTETLATHTAVVAGAVCAVLVVLSAWDEDVLQVGH